MGRGRLSFWAQCQQQPQQSDFIFYIQPRNSGGPAPAKQTRCSRATQRDGSSEKRQAQPIGWLRMGLLRRRLSVRVRVLSEQLIWHNFAAQGIANFVHWRGGVIILRGQMSIKYTHRCVNKHIYRCVVGGTPLCSRASLGGLNCTQVTGHWFGLSAFLSLLPNTLSPPMTSMGWATTRVLVLRRGEAEGDPSQEQYLTLDANMPMHHAPQHATCNMQHATAPTANTRAAS